MCREKEGEEEMEEHKSHAACSISQNEPVHYCSLNFVQI